MKTKQTILGLGMIVVVLLLSALSARQAVIVNPRTAIFTASPDQAIVTNYVLEIYRQSDLNTVVRSTDLGKPTPVGTDITVPLVKTGLVNNTNYVFQIVTNSPGGSVRSPTPSNPFVWADPAAPATNLRAQ